jgi:methylated-DNA-[protein]-cysteine S-methyltransferase
VIAAASDLLEVVAWPSPLICFAPLTSPLGRLLLVASPRGLCRVQFDAQPDPVWRQGGGVVSEAARQIEAYFAGTLRQFDLPIDLQGTPFQKRVWRELRTIPYGETRSYGEVARRIGWAGAARAVGAAAGRNPIAIVIACHRVIGKTGGLVGFSAGLARKRALLGLEGVTFSDQI